MIDMDLGEEGRKRDGSGSDILEVECFNEVEGSRVTLEPPLRRPGCRVGDGFGRVLDDLDEVHDVFFDVDDRFNFCDANT